MVSVLLLTYNQEAYIAQAIESALMQKTDFDFEILIGDDRSTDGTTAIVERYATVHDRIRLINGPHNVGAVANERRLMENARGKYFAFLEGDDFWTDPQKLQKQVDFLEANPDYGLVHSDADYYHEITRHTERQVNKSKGIVVPEGQIFNDLISPQPYFIKTATVCFRSELVKHFDYDKAIAEHWPLTDLPLWLDIAAHSKAHYFDEVFATYRLLTESASRTTSPERKLRYHLGLHRIKQVYLDKYTCSADVRERIDEAHYRGLLAIAFNLSDATLARESVGWLTQTHKSLSFRERLLYAGACYKPVKLLLMRFR